MNTYEILKHAQEDLKYLERLNYLEFKELLFPTTIETYSIPKWELFSDNKLSFIWSCSYDKLKLLANYIDNCKGVK